MMAAVQLYIIEVPIWIMSRVESEAKSLPAKTLITTTIAARVETHLISNAFLTRASQHRRRYFASAPFGGSGSKLFWRGPQSSSPRFMTSLQGRLAEDNTQHGGMSIIKVVREGRAGATPQK